MKKIFLSCLVLLVMISGAPDNGGYQVGDVVSDFKLKNVDGKMVSLSDWKDAKGYIVVFDCNTCPYSKKYNDRIKALSQMYTSKGFPLVAINPNSPDLSSGESFDEMVKIAKKKEYNFPYLYNEEQDVIRAFGATNTPQVFILTRTGSTLKVAYIGAIDDNPGNASGAKQKYVEDAVNELLSGKAVTNSKTKAIGCTVKLKNA